MSNEERVPRILLMGPGKSGKSSIQQVVFEKLAAHDTLFLASTQVLNIQKIAHNKYVKYEIWDFPGPYDFSDYIAGPNDTTLAPEDVLSDCGAIVFVLDGQQPIIEAEKLKQLHDIVLEVSQYNPDIHINIFIHKVDGDLFISEDQKIECHHTIEQIIVEEFQCTEMDLSFSYYLTSIYDHSIFEAFSKVIQDLIPQKTAMENLLNNMIHDCDIEKAFVFDVINKIYIATDHNPLDIQHYELCSDMLDVVVDVSCIYGWKEGEEEGAFDELSHSVIRLNNNMILYLREVSRYLALVCLVRQPNFQKQALIDYNMDCFKIALEKVFNPNAKGVSCSPHDTDNIKLLAPIQGNVLKDNEVEESNSEVENEQDFTQDVQHPPTVPVNVHKNE